MRRSGSSVQCDTPRGRKGNEVLLANDVVTLINQPPLAITHDHIPTRLKAGDQRLLRIRVRPRDATLRDEPGNRRLRRFSQVGSIGPCGRFAFSSGR